MELLVRTHSAVSIAEPQHALSARFVEAAETAGKTPPEAAASNGYTIDICRIARAL